MIIKKNNNDDNNQNKKCVFRIKSTTVVGLLWAKSSAFPLL